jgi:LPXTG-motif cell wall-anchored protein
MKTLRLAIATTMAAAFLVFAQTPAQAYPIESCSVSDRTVTGGDDVTVQVTASPEEPGTSFEVTYQGQTRSGTGTSFSAEFDTPSVDEETDTTAFASVTRDGQTVPCSGTITLLPADDDDDDDDDGDGDGDGDGDDGGLLPNTGGERLLWLIIGAMLILVGGGVVVASRRRDA